VINDTVMSIFGYAPPATSRRVEILDASLLSLDGRLAWVPGPRCAFPIPPK